MGAHFSSLAEAADANNLAAVESFLATCDTNEKDPVRQITLLHMHGCTMSPRILPQPDSVVSLCQQAGV